MLYIILSFCHYIEIIVNRTFKIQCLYWFCAIQYVFTESILFSFFFFFLLCPCSFYIDYGVEVWHPNLAKNFLRLKRVQNKLFKYAAFTLNIQHQPHDYTHLRQVFNTP